MASPAFPVISLIGPSSSARTSRRTCGATTCCSGGGEKTHLVHYPLRRGELFNLVAGYAPGEFACSPTFNGVARSDRVVVVEITLRRGRSDAMKRALYAAIARNLQTMAGVAPADVFIFMHENDYSDWSVGHGRFAMDLVQNHAAA